MGKPTQRRWTCPLCGAGKLAPKQPRRDDVRRYCLPCSEKTGRMVERVCAANERERAAGAARSKRKAQSKRNAAGRIRKAQRERDRARRHVAGVDVKRFCDRVWRAIHASKHRGNMLPRTTPEAVVRLAGERSWRTITGHAYLGRWRITMTFNTDATRADVEYLIIHELSHLGCPRRMRDDGKHDAHGDAFNRLMLDVARRFYGPRFDVGPATGGGGYGPSRWLRAEMRGMYRDKAVREFRAKAAEHFAT